MLDTIEMLEVIGRDASLRHASAHDLGTALAKAHASEALTAAVASGDTSALFAELGYKLMQVPQVNQHYCGPA
ncbi:MAG TPA: hypothetical protein VM621_19000 [Luteibacter sp.]|uniref:hypothetical protein n=1 Tax=Luteibacter sp. TaxID=1886636 RepID=UPI002C253CE3|nr:hypothetical protein [Luteibacter sp.]HVI57136.1 hypothetical protein [Luteibacter sp.]